MIVQIRIFRIPFFLPHRGAAVVVRNPIVIKPLALDITIVSPTHALLLLAGQGNSPRRTLCVRGLSRAATPRSTTRTATATGLVKATATLVAAATTIETTTATARHAAAVRVEVASTKGVSLGATGLKLDLLAVDHVGVGVLRSLVASSGLELDEGTALLFL